MLGLKGITLTFGTQTVLKDASLGINPKSTMLISGPGGSGKTVLFQLLIGQRVGRTGSVSIDGIDLRTLPRDFLQLYRRRMGLIWQLPHLLSHLTIAENIALPLELAEAPTDIVNRNVQDIIKRLELDHCKNTLPGNASASEKQLACIARAIVASPSIILADEPFELLDTAQQDLAKDVLLALQKKGASIVIFSRDTSIARSFPGCRTVRIANGSLQEKQSDATVDVERDAIPHNILEEMNKKITSTIQTVQRAKKRALPVRSKSQTAGTKSKVKITPIGS